MSCSLVTLFANLRWLATKVQWRLRGEGRKTGGAGRPRLPTRRPLTAEREVADSDQRSPRERARADSVADVLPPKNSVTPASSPSATDLSRPRAWSPRAHELREASPHERGWFSLPSCARSFSVWAGSCPSRGLHLGQFCLSSGLDFFPF